MIEDEDINGQYLWLSKANNSLAGETVLEPNFWATKRSKLMRFLSCLRSIE